MNRPMSQIDGNSGIENLKLSAIGTVDLTQMLGEVLNFVRPLIDHGINSGSFDSGIEICIQRLKDIQQLASDEHDSR